MPKKHFAFVLSRPFDLPIARLCEEHFESLGWTARVMLDPREWPEGLPEKAVSADYWTGGRGMFGNKCAAEIVAGMAKNSSPDSVVLKTDCDVRISEKASEWIKGASDIGRCMNIGQQRWGGVWAAPARFLGRIEQAIRNGPRCSCPESQLCLKAISATCGLEISGEVKKYRIGSDVSEAEAWTLPLNGKAAKRMEAGLTMFG